MTELADLKTQRASTKGCITRLKNLLEAKADSLTYAELECRLGILESYFKQILSYQLSIEKLTPEDSNEAKVRSELEDLYCAIKSKLLTLMAGHRKPSLVAENPVRTPNLTVSNLPKLKLPQFSGRYSEFPSFIGTFNKLVHAEESLSAIEKFNHLLSCLSGPALLTVKAYEVTEENYAKALKHLKDRYENLNLIFQEHIVGLFNLPRVSKNSPQQLRQLVDYANAHLSALQSIGTYVDITNAIIIHLVTSKLDPESQSKWEDSIDLSKLPTWTECRANLNRRCQNLELRDSKSSQVELGACSRAHNKFKGKRFNDTVTALTAAKIACLFCLKDGHMMQKCPSFLELSSWNRFEEVKKRALCINCLSKGHSVKKCRSQKCHICSMPHHSLLHRYSSTKSNEAKAPGDSPSGSPDSLVQSSLLSNNSKKTHVFLATAVVKVRDSFGRYHFARALLDSASQLNFITENLTQLLNLKRTIAEMNISGIGEVSSKVRGSTQTVIKSRVNEFETDLSLFVLSHITGLQPGRKVSVDNWNIPRNIQLADPDFYTPQKVDLLIGADTFFQLLSVGQIKPHKELPILQKTVLGWVVAGKYSEPPRVVASCNLVSEGCSEAIQDRTLSNLVEKFWREEEIPTKNINHTEEMLACEKIFSNTFRRLSDGRFMVKLPFKIDPQNNLKHSFEIAQRRFLSLEKRLSKNAALKANYSEFLHEYLASDHMESVSRKDLPPVQYFMPHQCILRPQSSSTKLRVVFDASCRTSTNKSLNDLLMVGPTVQDDLFSIIFRFRTYKFALTADIAAMYRQVLVYPEDRNFQLITWRENPEDELQIFRLKTVTYGTSSAPFLATRCLLQLAKDHALQMPQISKIIQSDFYMDDLITGADTREELCLIKDQVDTILKSAQFHLRKWYSNDVNFTNGIPETERENLLNLNDVDVIKTLGVVWEPTKDEIRFQYSDSSKGSSKITKRSILSDLSRLFDPLGLVNPVIVKAKVFLQELWLMKLHWDESIPMEIATRWRKYKEELSYLNEIHIPRLAVSTEGEGTIEIHGFADASVRAYGCSIYLKSGRDTNISVALVAAKSKVAPISGVRSLPCLELCAALLLSRLIHKIKDNIRKPYSNIYLWTDSEIVLDWLQHHPSTWKTYVANRVSEIQELTKYGIWRHVTSKDNPADIISRGTSAKDLASSMWFRGPQFLYEPKNSWPASKNRHLSIENLPEKRTIKSILVCSISDSFLDEIYSCSNFQRNCRRFAVVLRFLSNTKAARSHKTSTTGELTAGEIEEAFLRIVWAVQQAEFTDEIRTLEKGEELNRSSRLRKLTPFLDKQGGIEILRVGGRLRNAELPYDCKSPILLPSNNAFVHSYVRDLHLKNFHAGPSALVALIHRKCWIVNARDYARKIVRKCIHCFRYKPRLAQQIMGDLPSGRVNMSLPFTHTGVDFCGPLKTTYKIRGKVPYKSYIAIFVCFVTRAVHIEIVSDLSADAFLAALKRFVGRRNLCRHLYCDNATNFVGARRQLEEFRATFFKQHTQQEVHAWCSNNQIEFHHIPPRSPHFGGLWEAAVKSAKTHLYRTLKDALLTFEELCTVMVQIEGILNSRPITALSTDPNDEQALTPAHFLNQAPLGTLIEPNLLNQNFSYLRRWQRISALQQHFWKRWSAEYVSQLQEKSKWHSHSPNIDVGTLVVLQQDDLPPYKWQLGRVTEVFRGTDGNVRVVQVRTSTGSFKRAIHKVGPLPQDT